MFRILGSEMLGLGSDSPVVLHSHLLEQDGDFLASRVSKLMIESLG
jgi:hypothetical protein